MVNKHIFITNGVARSGKDTFADFVAEMVATEKVSSIDYVKYIAKRCEWDPTTKTEKDRKFLSDLKMLMTEYNDLPYRTIQEAVERFHKNPELEVLIIDIREPEEIDRAKREFGADTILIVNPYVPHITSNEADRRVYEYEYDWIIYNTGTLEEYEKKVEDFLIQKGIL